MNDVTEAYESPMTAARGRRPVWPFVLGLVILLGLGFMLFRAAQRYSDMNRPRPPIRNYEAVAPEARP